MQIDDIFLEFNNEQDAKIAAKLGRDLARNISIFQKSIGQYPNLRTHVVIAEDHDEYQSFISSSKEIVEFSQAFYSPSRKTIFIRNPRDNLHFADLNRILFHEYLHHFVFYHFQDAPLWFHEGMAVYFSKDFSQGRELNLAAQHLMGNTREISEMNYYPDNRIEWESFYAKSALAVRYLYTKKKMRFHDLWNNAKPYRKFNPAFHRSFFLSVSSFSEEFENYSANHFKSTSIIFIGSLIWMLMPLLFILSILRGKYKEKQLLKKMELEEKAEIGIDEVEQLD